MKYIILGGGTAGWLTALYLNKHFPNDEVTVVASSEIGILGAGEGTTPVFMEYLDEVGITEAELVSNCKATLKTGIKFTNWNGDGENYFHNFWDDKYALHFDASLLAKYLQDVATNRGIKLIDDEVIKVLPPCKSPLPDGLCKFNATFGGILRVKGIPLSFMVPAKKST